MCWHVVDTQSGDVVWTLGDSVDALQTAWSGKNVTGTQVIEWEVNSAVISTDGTLLALLVTEPGRGQVFVVNIEDKAQAVHVAGPPTKITQMRWDIRP